MDERQRQHYALAQRYSDQQIGRWMNSHLLVVAQNMRVAEALRLLRREAPNTPRCSTWLTAPAAGWAVCASASCSPCCPHQQVSCRRRTPPSLDAEDNMYEAAEVVAASGYSALPVLNKEGVLLGRIDMSTAVELLHEQAERQRMALAGLAEDADLFAPPNAPPAPAPCGWASTCSPRSWPPGLSACLATASNRWWPQPCLSCR